MDIAQFAYKLELVAPADEMRTTDPDTSYITIDDFKKAFCVTPAWKQQWPNVAALCRTYLMKELVVCNTIKGFSHKIQEDQCINYTTKLEVGALALLWCSGSQELKAKFMTNLANPRGDEFITHTGSELRFIFKKLLYNAVILPEKYYEHASQRMEGARRESKGRRSRSNSSSSSGSDDDRVENWDISKVNDVKVMCEEEESYLNSFYRDCFAELVFPFGHSHMRTEKFIEVLSRENFAWVFDPEQLRGRFMSAPRSSAVREFHTPAGGDFQEQIDRARNAVENRHVEPRNGRRGNSSSSGSDSGRRNVDHLPAIAHVDVDSQEGGHIQSDYVRHQPTTVRRSVMPGAHHTSALNASAHRVSRLASPVRTIRGGHELNSSRHVVDSHQSGYRPSVVKRIVISPGGTRREVDGHHGDAGRMIGSLGHAITNRVSEHLQADSHHPVNVSNHSSRGYGLNRSHQSGPHGAKTVEYTDVNGHTKVIT